MFVAALLFTILGSTQTSVLFTLVATRPFGGGAPALRARRACATAGAYGCASYRPSAFNGCADAKLARSLLDVPR